MPTYRILAAFIPIQAALLLAFARCSTQRPTIPGQTDRIVISKSSHTMALYSHGQITHTYRVALGRATGPKQFEGDHKTPEGHYTVDAKNPHSLYHLAMHLSYPNPADRTRAAAEHHPPGGNVEIHGLPAAYAYLGPLHRAVDWTDGCIAVTNSEIEEIFRLTPTGTPVDIAP